MTRGYRARGASLLATVALVVSGCTTVVDGSPVKPAGGPPAGTVDVALLDPGNYPTKPQPPMGVAPNPTTGSLLDAQRMADFALGPWEVDPTLTTREPFGFTAGAMPIKSDALEAVTSKEAAQAAYRHDFINGYADQRGVKGQKILLNAVLRMPDPESARAAAREMAQASLANPDDADPPPVATPKPIPGHPETNAISWRFHSTTDNVVWNVVLSFTAHGPYVLQQQAQVTSPSLDDPPSMAAASDAAAGLVAKTIDLQGPRIDGFAPTDPAQLSTLPWDPSGLLAKALKVPKGGANANNQATFGAYGLLHYMDDPVEMAKVLTAAGVDVAVHGDDWVIQARDAAGALAVADAQVKSSTGPDATTADPVPNLPGSRCLKYSSGAANFWCVSTVDRYEFEVSGPQLKDVHQRTAAQYIILTAK
jgi:hypothetical protein